MNVLLMIVFIICAAVLYTCYKSAKDLEKNSKLPKAPSEDVNKKGAAVLWNAVTGYPYGRTVKCVRTAITATINIAK